MRPEFSGRSSRRLKPSDMKLSGSAREEEGMRKRSACRAEQRTESRERALQQQPWS
jgi:hypothetical protein